MSTDRLARLLWALDSESLLWFAVAMHLGELLRHKHTARGSLWEDSPYCSPVAGVTADECKKL